jgi:hypothetical protein
VKTKGLRTGADTEAAPGALFKVDLDRSYSGLRVDLAPYRDTIEPASFNTAAATLAVFRKKEGLWLDPELGDFGLHTLSQCE